MEDHRGDAATVMAVRGPPMCNWRTSSASVAQARAALVAANADRDHVYAGVRAEEIAFLAATIAKAKSRLEYAGLQHDRMAYLLRSYAASQQSLDQAANDLAAAHADVTEAEANPAAAQAGPTAE